jgi:hypothetical protein
MDIRTGDGRIFAHRDDRVENVLTVTTSYIVPKLAAEKDGNWFVRFLPANVAGAFAIPTSSVRRTPLSVPRFPFEASYSFEAKFPEEVSVINDPTTNTVEDKYFAATITRAFRGNLSKATIDVRTLSSQVEPQDVQKFAEDLRSLNTAIGGTIVAGPWADARTIREGFRLKRRPRADELSTRPRSDQQHLRALMKLPHAA